MLRITAIIVSFNTKDLLRRCLASLSEADEIIVVDNDSADGSGEMVQEEFPLVKLIRNSTNLGFGRANNQGLQAMSGDLALLINSDIEAHPGSINALRELMSSKEDVVACGGGLVSSDGGCQSSAARELTLWTVFCEQFYLEKLFPGSLVFNSYWVDPGGNDELDVEQVMGACLCFRPKERFDERFFLYCEDTELCKRLRAHGRILYLPSAKFTHELGASSQDRWKAVALYNRGKELYFTIHRGSIAAMATWCLNRIGALLRLVSALIPALLTLFLWEPGRTKTAIFTRVLFAPLRGPATPLDTLE